MTVTACEITLPARGEVIATVGGVVSGSLPHLPSSDVAQSLRVQDESKIVSSAELMLPSAFRSRASAAPVAGRSSQRWSIVRSSVSTSPS